jgi:hypothetical protein
VVVLEPHVPLLVSNGSFTVANALAALLTAESLLFAATTVGVGLSASSAFGAVRPVSPFVLAFVATIILFVVAFGAATAWWDVYVTAWQWTFTRVVQAVCIITGISAQPLFAAAIAINIKANQ